MVVQLADLLRRLLNAGERDFSRLADELQFVRLYLELQQKRFADRLAWSCRRPQDIADAWVPSLILQPLVENAVVHGLAGHQGPVVVRVAVERAGESLVLRVTNTIAAEQARRPPTASASATCANAWPCSSRAAPASSAGPRGAQWVQRDHAAGDS